MLRCFVSHFTLWRYQVCLRQLLFFLKLGHIFDDKSKKTFKLDIFWSSFYNVVSLDVFQSLSESCLLLFLLPRLSSDDS